MAEPLREIQGKDALSDIKFLLKWCYLKPRLFPWNKVRLTPDLWRMTHEALVKLLTNEESHYCNNVRLCMLFLKHFVLFTHGEILSISLYSVRMREKLRIWTLFTQCYTYLSTDTLCQPHLISTFYNTYCLLVSYVNLSR